MEEEKKVVERRGGRIGSSRMSAEPPRKFGSAPIDIVGTYRRRTLCGRTATHGGGPGRGRGERYKGHGKVQGAAPIGTEIPKFFPMDRCGSLLSQGRNCFRGTWGAIFSGGWGEGGGS